MKTTALRGRRRRGGRGKGFFWGGGRSKCAKYRRKYAGRCFWVGGDFWGKSKKSGCRNLFGVG